MFSIPAFLFCVPRQIFPIPLLPHHVWHKNHLLFSTNIFPFRSTPEKKSYILYSGWLFCLFSPANYHNVGASLHVKLGSSRGEILKGWILDLVTGNCHIPHLMLWIFPPYMHLFTFKQCAADIPRQDRNRLAKHTGRCNACNTQAVHVSFWSYISC